MKAVSLRHLARVGLAIAFLLAGASQAFSGEMLAKAEVAYVPHPRIFGTIDIYSPNLTPFWKWTTMLQRFRDEERQAKGVCHDGQMTRCVPAEWHELVTEMKGLSLRAKLDLVNSAINHHRYVRSIDNWGQVNYWETPFQFMQVGGQCQDYAITKYLLLRAAGVPASRLRVVVLRDMNLQLDHAVLVAFVDGDALILDNLINQVVSASVIHHYRPYYSINEAGWWRQVPVHTEPATTVASAEPSDR